MQKIGIVFILVLFSLLAFGQQDSTDYTLNNIKKYAAHIDQSFSIISSNTAEDKQQASVQQAENIKVFIDSIEDEMQYLPDVYYYRLSPFVSSYHTDVDEFEKLLLNSDFEGKDAFLARAFSNLRQRQSEFRKALYSAYSAALPQQSLPEDKRSNINAQEDTVPVEQHDIAGDTTSAARNNAVLVEAVDPNEITTSNNSLLLDTIQQAQQEIDQKINSIHSKIKQHLFNEVGAEASSISKASLKISDLTLLLKTDQKQSLFILATGLKNLSETLQKLSLKGMAAQEDMQDCIDEIGVKFSTLSTGINLVH